MNRLNQKYTDVVVPNLMKKFNYKSVMEVPYVDKIVINMGIGEAIANPKVLDEAVAELAQITGQAPVITNVKVSGSTIKVTYKAAANATGYDVVLGTGSKKENGETRPYQYGNHKKLNLKEGTVTATFKNVPKGTWVVGMHAFNRTSEDGKKVFSPWSNLKKATVK